MLTSSYTGEIVSYADRITHRNKLILLTLFAISFAYVEAAVVVYLREIVYPEGFSFPLKDIPVKLIIIELFRELATIVMLLSASVICGRRGWERFGYFLIVFGVWDLFYYVWLKATINWPSSLTEWDVLFLIPLPWIGPVLAPVLISLLMVITGIGITRLYEQNLTLKPGLLSWGLGIIATVLILYSFMSDFQATLDNQMPNTYAYYLLVAGLLLYAIGFAIPYRAALKSGS